MTDFPVRNVIIPGMTARAFQLLNRPVPYPKEVMTVKTAADVDKALGDEGNEHCCPLCNEYFGTKAFQMHARQCIEARAPRDRVWTPAGFSANAIQHHSDERPSRPGAGRFG